MNMRRDDVLRSRRLEGDMAGQCVDKVARKLKANSSVALIASTKQSLTLRQKAFSAHEKAQQSLATNPGDTQANLDEGLWLAVFNDDWSTALPLLAKSSDPQWKAAATAELAADETVDSQLKVADAWWEYAQSAPSCRATKRCETPPSSRVSRLK